MMLLSVDIYGYLVASRPLRSVQVLADEAAALQQRARLGPNPQLTQRGHVVHAAAYRGIYLRINSRDLLEASIQQGGILM